ncbi:MAG TPA: serine/threonine-protein kinase [Vicinamibacterales bacterium]
MGRIADDRTRLLDLASSISDGTDIDWKDVGAAVVDEETTGVMTQLQVVEQIARLHGASRGWDSLQIRDTVGRGPFSIVYRAFDPDLEREIALKVVRFGVGDAGGIDRAVRDARMLTRIRHPHVLRVFRAERHGHEMGLWLERIDGETLADLVRVQGPLSAREATLVGLDLCRALAAVHGAGLVHGDVNAHNVMRERRGRIVLMDFGAAKELARRDDHAANPAASAPSYVAPEVFSGARRSTASDIYGLGVLLCYLLTGTFPVDGTIGTVTGRRPDRMRPQKSLRGALPDLPLRLVQAVERALHARPDGRYARAGDFERALLDALPRTARVLRGLTLRWPWQRSRKGN